MTAEEWLSTIAPGVPNTLLASAIGKTPSTVTRWKSGDIPIGAEDVIALARHFQASVPDSLVACGFIRPDEASARIGNGSLEGVPSEALLEELMRRNMSARYHLGVLQQRSRAVMQESPDTGTAEFAKAVYDGLMTYKTEVAGRNADDPFL